MVADGPARSSVAPHRASGTDRPPPVLNTERLTPPPSRSSWGRPAGFRRNSKRPRKRHHHPCGANAKQNARLRSTANLPRTAPGAQRHCLRSAAVPSRSSTDHVTLPECVPRPTPLRTCCGWGQPRPGHVPKADSGGAVRTPISEIRRGPRESSEGFLNRRDAMSAEVQPVLPSLRSSRLCG